MEDQEQKLKQRVEGALGEGPDSLLPATWDAIYGEYGRYYLAHLRDGISALGWESKEEAWADVVGYARQQLQRQKDIIRQHSRRELRPRKPEPEEGSEHPAVERLSERTKARGRALSEYYAFRIGDDTPIRPMRVKLRAGGPQVVKDLEDPNSDLDIRQVIILEVQAWVSPEEVARVFRTVRANLLEEEERIQAKPSTLEIGTFAWREWRRAKEEGRDLPTWAELKRLWLEDHPGDKRIEGHGDFQRYFNRAKEAVFPRYRETLFPAPPDLKAEIEAREARMIRGLSAHAKKTENAPLFEGRPPGG